MTKVQLKKAIPIIGAISSGKSFFVDSLLGLDILESESKITTKFVCIIQHHKNLKEPRFYQINLSEKDLDENNMMVYEGTLKGDIITGHEKIKTKIKEINNLQKNIPNDQIKYEDLFYVLEIQIKNIKNEKLLDNYDFYDIPGLDEYIPDQEEDKNKNDLIPKNDNEKLNDKMKYIEGLFKYFKSKIDFGVFVINAESAYANSSKEVILNVANTIKPKKIHNYLIILNKIDRQSEPNITIKKVKSIITNNLLNEMNLSDNKFIPLDSRQLKHQTLMKENFENFLTFLFNQYFSKSVIPFKDNREGSEEEKKFNTKNYTFFDFLSEFVTKGKEENQIDEYLEELEEKFNNNYDFDELKLNEIIENIKKQEKYKINFGIDLENDDNINLFKCLYICFKEQINMPYSNDVNSVFSYFDKVVDDLDKYFYDELAPPPAQLISQDFRTQFENFTKKFKRFHEENKNFQIIGDLNISIEQLYNYIENQQIIYIGIFGNSSTGKSVIFNNIFGIDILTVNENECTKRGIIIEEGQNVAMYVATSEIKKLNGRGFNIFKRKECIAVGEDNVRDMLEQLNNYYAEETDNGEFNFFIISLPIKFFDEINLEPEIRKSIKFIDLPGYNTSKANNFIYEPVIESISCFLMVFKASSIGSTDNLKSASIYQNLKYKSKRAVKSLNDSEFLKCCLFIMNLWDDELPTEENLRDWSNTIKKFILKVFVDDDNVNFNLTYLNALLYHNFLDNEKFYSNYESLQEYILYQYNNKSFKFGKKSFIKFFAETLKKDIKEIFKIKETSIKQILKDNFDSEIYKRMNMLFQNSSDITGFIPENDKDYEKNLKETCSYLSYIQKNIKNTSDYKNSHIETFFKDLSNKIVFSRELVNKDFKEHLINAIDIFNIFFNIDIENQNQEKKEEFIKESLRLYQQLEKCFQSYDFDKIFNTFISKIELFFMVMSANVDDLLEKNNKDIEKILKDIIEEYKTILGKFQEELKEYYEKFIKSVEEIYNALVQYLELETPKINSEITTNYGFKAHGGALLGKIGLFYGAMITLTVIEGIFPPLVLLTIPAGIALGYFFGGKIFEHIHKIFNKKAKLIDALNNMKNSQIDEIKLMQKRFMRDLNDKIETIKNNIMSLINVKVLELSNKSNETKQFYTQLKNDYENLLKSIKNEFNI